jgi:hypothetical protein
MATGGISAGAASRKIEYSAEAIIELASVGQYDLDSNRVNLTFSKNRNGRAGVKIGFTFTGATQRFVEAGEPWEDIPVCTSRTPKPTTTSVPATSEGYEDRDLFGV